MKAMHRLIMLSRTYQLASEGPESNLAVDADNRIVDLGSAPSEPVPGSDTARGPASVARTAAGS